MKRTELLKKLNAVANSNGLLLELVREGGNHTIYRVGAYQFTVARHREVPEETAKGMLRRVAQEKGEE